jgi:HSP20 family protein
MRGGFAPDLDIHETDQGLEIAVELPGLSEDDIDLRIEGDQLILSGEKRDERQQAQGNRHTAERVWGRFQRSLRLPFTPDQDQVQAHFDRGVLHIAIARPAQQRQGGRIPIRAGQATPRPAGAHVEPAGGHATLTATGGDSTGTSGSKQDPLAGEPQPGATGGASSSTLAASGGSAQGMAPESRSDQAPGNRHARDAVEEASRESFPASDPPANTGITGTVSRT